MTTTEHARHTAGREGFAPKKAGNVVRLDYQGGAIGFTGDGWFNATEAAARFGKLPHEWLRLPETERYLQALEGRYGKIPYVKTSKARSDRGGGTWMHPKLAVRFAQWLDVDFAVWCDEQVDSLIRGKPPNWRKLRHEAATGYKVMSAVLQLTRQEAGKATEPHHYANEARLINSVLTGQFKALDRRSLSGDDMGLLVRLEAQDTILLARGAIYQDRKRALEQCAMDWRLERSRALGAA